MNINLAQLVYFQNYAKTVTDESEMRKLVKTSIELWPKTFGIIWNLSLNPAATASVLEFMINHSILASKSSVLPNIARHPNITPDLLDIIGNNGTDDSKREVIKNKNSRIETIQQILKSNPTINNRCLIATRLDLTLEMFQELSNDSDLTVRQILATNKNCPDSICLLLYLSDDINYQNTYKHS